MLVEEPAIVKVTNLSQVFPLEGARQLVT